MMILGLMLSVTSAKAQTCSIPNGYIACASSTLTTAHATCGYRVVNGFCTLTACAPNYELVSGKCQLPPAVSFFSVDRTIQSGDYTLAVYAQLAKAPAGVVTVDLSTAASTAMAADYELLTPQAVFNGYQYSSPIFIKIKRNPGDFPNRTIAIRLAAVSQGSATITSADTLTFTISAQASQSIQLAADDVTVTAGQNALVKVHLSAINSVNFPTFVSARYFSGDDTAIAAQQVDGAIPAGAVVTLLSFPTNSRATPSVAVVKLSIRTAGDILITKSISIITVTATPLNCIPPQVASGSSCVTIQALAMSPSASDSPSLLGGQSIQFNPSGGMPPYYWSSDFGGRVTLDGYYTANNTAGNSVVTLKDSQGNTVSTTVAITATQTLTVSPSTPPTLDKSESFKFNGIAGAPPYTWSVSGGGSIASDGKLIAPNATGQVTVTLTDSAFNHSSAVVTVVNPVAISPLNPSSSINTGTTLQFTGSGGVGPYTWAANGGGSISANGLLTAPSNGGALTVFATDSRGKVATSLVMIAATSCPSLQHLSSGVCIPDTFTPSLSTYSPASLPVCGGTATGTRTITSCLDNQTSALVSTSNCTDPTPSVALSSSAGSQSCSIANGLGSQTCVAGSTTWGACGVVSCNANFHSASGSCVADTFTASYSPYSNNTVTAACSGSQVASRSITACTRDYDSLSVAISKCSDPSPTTTYQSPAGAQSCSIANGIGTQSCAVGSTSPSACVAASCSANFHASSGACVADTYTATYSPYAANTVTAVCSGSQTASRSITACTRDNDGASMSLALCSDPSPTTAYQSPGGSQACSIANGAGSQTCSAGGTSWSTCALNTCNANFHQVGSSCVADSRACSIANGAGSQTWDANLSAFGACQVVSCITDFHQASNACVADTYTPSFSSYAANTVTAVCSGSQTAARSVTACTRDYDSLSVATTKCTDPSPSTTYQSPAGSQSCSIANGIGTQSCAIGSAAPSACVAASCSSGFHISSGACVIDTYTATYSAYAPSTLAVCAGSATASRSITACVDDQTSSQVATTNCTDPSPTQNILSPAGSQACAIANGTGTQACALGTSIWGACAASSCNSGYYASADNSSCVINPSISPISWTMQSTSSKQFTAAGGTAPYTWSSSAGSVTSAGLFSPGNSNGVQTVTVTDSAGHAASAAVTVTAMFNLTLTQPSIGSISGAVAGSFASGTAINLTYAGANTSGNWTGACTSSLASPCSFSMTADKTVGASASCLSLYHSSGGSCFADTFTASYSAYSPASIAVCAGSVTASRSITACMDDQSTASVALSNCSDPSPTQVVSSPSGNQACPITNGTGTQACAAGSSVWGACSVYNCNSGFKIQSGACVAGDNIVGTPTPSVDTSGTVGTPVQYSLTFTRPPTSLAATDFTVTNGSISNFSYANGTASFLVTAIGNGTVEVTLPEGAVRDVYSNPNTLLVFRYVYQYTAPTGPINLTLTQDSGNQNRLYLTADQPLGAAFSIYNVATSTTNGVITNWAYDGTVGTIDIQPSSAGQVTFYIPANSFTNDFGNTNNAVSFVYNYSPPPVGVTVQVCQYQYYYGMGSCVTPTKVTGPFTLLVTYAVNMNPTAGMPTIQVSGGGSTPATPNWVDNSHALVDVVPSMEGVISINISGGVANDGSYAPGDSISSSVHYYHNYMGMISNYTNSSSPFGQAPAGPPDYNNPLGRFDLETVTGVTGVKTYATYASPYAGSVTNGYAASVIGVPNAVYGVSSAYLDIFVYGVPNGRYQLQITGAAYAAIGLGTNYVEFTDIGASYSTNGYILYVTGNFRLPGTDGNGHTYPSSGFVLEYDVQYGSGTPTLHSANNWGSPSHPGVVVLPGTASQSVTLDKLMFDNTSLRMFGAYTNIGSSSISSQPMILNLDQSSSTIGAVDYAPRNVLLGSALSSTVRITNVVLPKLINNPPISGGDWSYASTKDLIYNANAAPTSSTCEMFGTMTAGTSKYFFKGNGPKAGVSQTPYLTSRTDVTSLNAVGFTVMSNGNVTIGKSDGSLIQYDSNLSTIINSTNRFMTNGNTFAGWTNIDDGKVAVTFYHVLPSAVNYYEQNVLKEFGGLMSLDSDFMTQYLSFPVEGMGNNAVITPAYYDTARKQMYFLGNEIGTPSGQFLLRFE
jgi:hypothetical protein